MNPQWKDRFLSLGDAAMLVGRRTIVHNSDMLRVFWFWPPMFLMVLAYVLFVADPTPRKGDCAPQQIPVETPIPRPPALPLKTW